MKTPLEVLRPYAAHDYTLLGAFASRMRRDPRRPFMVYEGRTWSWQEFHDALLRTARVLAARGIRHDHRAAVFGVCAQQAVAQQYPGKPVRLIVPVPFPKSHRT